MGGAHGDFCGRGSSVRPRAEAIGLARSFVVRAGDLGDETFLGLSFRSHETVFGRAWYA